MKHVRKWLLGAITFTMLSFSVGFGVCGGGTPKAPPTGITAIAAGYYHSLALKKDGTVWVCGYKVSGQLGNRTITYSNVPVYVSNLTDVKAIAGGHYHSLALKNDGIVWAWGRNEYGQLGIGTNANSNVPVQVSNLTDVKAIAAGRDHSFALKKDGTVWAWGRNEYGQLGNRTNANNYYVPVQVLTTPGGIALTGVTAIAGGYQHSLALKNDGTVRAWGYNGDRQLGNGTNTSSNLPVRVVWP